MRPHGPDRRRRCWADEESAITPTTTIVHFGVPVQNVDRFLDFWQQHAVRDEMFGVFRDLGVKVPQPSPGS